ncbi:MAG: hypothetical protein ACREUG_09615 [Steroidobacteraceae bacterium]
MSAAPGNAKLQKFMCDALRALSAATEIQPDRSRAIYWLRNTPIQEFSHRTAKQRVSRGRVDAVVADLESSASGSTG